MLKPITLIASLLLFVVGCGQTMQELGGSPSPNLNDGDNGFFKTIAIANKTEIDSSRMALDQSQNSGIRDFAQRMIDDHTAAQNELSTLARQKQVTLPTRLDSEHQSILDDLKSKSSTDFDKAYLDVQVKAHKDTIAADQDEANNGVDPQVKGLAGRLLDTLNMHLSMAQKLQNGSDGM